MEIELNNGQKVEISSQVSALTLYTLQNEKVITADFLKSIMTGAAGSDASVMPDVQAILQAVYAAYRQKNPKGMPFEEFLANYNFSMETDLEIYFAVISREARTAFQKSFLHKHAGKSKKK